MVGLASLAAVVAFLHVLFGVIPGAAGVGHEDGQHDTGDERACEKTAQGCGSQDDADQQGADNCHDAGNKHLVQGCLCGNGYTGSIIRFTGSFKDSRNGAELAADFFDHLVGCLGHRVHSQGREEKREHTAKEEPDNDFVVKQVDTLLKEPDCLGVGDEQGQGSESCGTDGKAFSHSSGGVSDSIQTIRDLADAGGKMGHLRDRRGRRR